MSKIGRPSNAERAERKLRKKIWRREEQERKRIEALIKQGRVEVLTREEYLVRMDADPNDSLDDVLIAFPPLSPAMKFLFAKTNGTTGEQFDKVWRQNMLDLLASDIPLDKKARGCIWAELWKFMNPAKARQSALRAEAEVIGWEIAELERRGMSPDEARDRIAEDRGRASGESLRKWLESQRD